MKVIIYMALCSVNVALAPAFEMFSSSFSFLRNNCFAISSMCIFTIIKKSNGTITRANSRVVALSHPDLRNWSRLIVSRCGL